MKISASVYSSKNKQLKNLIKELDDNHVDMFHIDCNDDLTVFDDIQTIKSLSNTPVDLHIISCEPEKFYDKIVALQVEYVTFQFEELNNHITLPPAFYGKAGIAITSNTPNNIFDEYSSQMDFILFMATIPGQSGGKFDKNNFKKIRDFRINYPDKRIHVDGGVNNEVSFILRNMGVYSSVSGSYLMNSDSMGSAMLNLKSIETDSSFCVADFMRTIEESPVLTPENRSVHAVLQSIEDYKLGFTILVDNKGALEGIISNADVRKGLLRNFNDLNGMKTDDIINHTPIVANENFTVTELLRFVKNQKNPISYLPVVNNNNVVTGVVTFVNLIKGEL